MKHLTHKFKYISLQIISKFLEELKIVSKSTGPQGTFDGEEFIFYREHFTEITLPFYVLDIGANTGLWAMEFLKTMGNGEVFIHAVEPIPEFFQLIIARNNPRIFAHNFAVGNDRGLIKIAKIGQGGTTFPNTDSNYPKFQKEISWHTVPTTSGDSLIIKLSFKPDLIKIDTDGFDFTILKSLHETLNRFRPVVQFEFTYRFAKKANYSLHEVVDFLEQHGYRVEVLTCEGKLRRVVFPRLEVLNHQTKNFIALPRD